VLLLNFFARRPRTQHFNRSCPTITFSKIFPLVQIFEALLGHAMAVFVGLSILPIAISLAV
jgi:hypothetical protein